MLRGIRRRGACRRRDLAHRGLAVLVEDADDLQPGGVTQQREPPSDVLDERVRDNGHARTRRSAWHASRTSAVRDAAARRDLALTRLNVTPQTSSSPSPGQLPHGLRLSQLCAERPARTLALKHQAVGRRPTLEAASASEVAGHLAGLRVVVAGPAAGRDSPGAGCHNDAMAPWNSSSLPTRLSGGAWAYSVSGALRWPRPCLLRSARRDSSRSPRRCQPPFPLRWWTRCRMSGRVKPGRAQSPGQRSAVYRGRSRVPCFSVSLAARPAHRVRCRPGRGGRTHAVAD